MNRKYKFILTFVLIMVIGLGLSFLHFRKPNKEVFHTETTLSKEDKEHINRLINIDDLSQEFMDTYMEEVNDLDVEDANKRLIVIADTDDFDTYGANNVIVSPNNQYILEYSSKSKKEKAYEMLKEDDRVFSVDEDTIREFYETSDDYDLSSFMSWGMESTGLSNAIEVTEHADTEPIIAAIIDTGFNYSYVGTWGDKIISTYNIFDDKSMYDDQGHGTHVAGTIMEGTSSNVKILPIKVSNSKNLTTTNIIAAINYVTYNENADVINMSFGSSSNNTAEHEAIMAAYNKNIISVCASGNDGAGSSNYPALFEETISIGAVNKNLQLSSFSNYGDIDFVAPGESIKSLNGVYDGTSMATPHAVAAISLLKSFDYDLSMEEAKEQLKIHALDLGETGYDIYFGNGYIYFNKDSLCEIGENCLYKDQYEDVNYVKKIASAQSSYKVVSNYGNETNFLNASINVTYTDNKTVKYALWQLDDVVINGYDPNSHTIQNVVVTYEGFSTILVIDNTSNLELRYSYEVIPNTNNVRITGFNINTAQELHKVIIPSEIDGYTVTSIADGVNNNGIFKNASYVSYFVIPETITYIGSYAFQNLANIYGMKILASHISAGAYAFANVHGLRSLDAAIDSAKEHAFDGCDNLEEVHYSNDATIVSPYTFAGAKKLKTVVLGENISSIETHAFENNLSLLSITTNDNLQSIKTEAFAGSALENIYIGKSVSAITSTAFNKAKNLKTITVDPLNTTFDSRDNCNAIINSTTNELVIGAIDTVIPSTVVKINDNSFISRNVTSIIIPASVTKIGSSSFANCTYLDKIAFLNPNISMVSSSFSGRNSELKFYVYKNSTAETYATNNNITKYYIDEVPFDYHIHLNKLTYYVGDEPDLTDSSVTLIYADPSIPSVTYTPEDNAYVGYCANSFTFKKGDTYFVIRILNKYEVKIPVTVEEYKRPDVHVPEGLTGIVGNKLSSVSLPGGLEWIDDTFTIKHAGIQLYRAKYNPGEASGYSVAKVMVPIEVSKGVLVPSFKNILKRYDGTNTLNVNSILFNNLIEGEYTILSASLDSSAVGDATATVTIKLSDKKFNDYTFSNGQKEMTFTTPATISENFLDYPEPVDKEYNYTGDAQYFEFLDFDSTKMTISNDSQTNAGTYTVKVTPKAGYVWNDGSNTAKEYTWIIKQKVIIPEIVIADKYYDTKEAINTSLVSVINLNKSDYQVVTASGDKSIGTHTAKVLILLLNSNYMFSNGASTMEFNAQFNVIRTKIPKPTLVDKKYTYNGENQSPSFDNYNLDALEMTNGVQKDVGTYTVIVSIKDKDSYEWNDGTNSDISFTFTILKKTIYPEISIANKTYDGKKDIDKSKISIANLNSSLYEIVTATSEDLIGKVNADIKIRLTNDAYKNMSFENDKQEATFTSLITIIKKTLDVTYEVLDDQVGYSGEETSFRIELDGDDKQEAKILYSNSNGEYVLEEIPKYKNTGTYEIKFKIYIDDRYYTVVYGTHNLKITYCILNVTVGGYEGLYDGKVHPLTFNVTGGDSENYFAVNNYNYSKNIPEFKEMGIYTVNYKVVSLICDPIVGTKEIGIYGIKGLNNVTIKKNVAILGNTSFNTLKNNTVVFGENYSYIHLDKNNQQVDRDLIYTGDKYKIYNPTYGSQEYLLAYPGDANGDGKISALDYVRIKNHIMGKTKITEDVFFYGADVTKDDKISALDYVRIKNHIMNGGM